MHEDIFHLSQDHAHSLYEKLVSFMFDLVVILFLAVNRLTVPEINTL